MAKRPGAAQGVIGVHSLLSPFRLGQKGSARITRTSWRREKGTMNAIRAVRPYRHERLWAFGGG